MNGHPARIVYNYENVSDMNPFPVSITSFVSSASATQTDAFGRLRISEPYTLFDSFHRYQDNGKITEYTSGTASSAHDANSSSILMTIGGNIGDKIYRESSRTFAYQPGKSLLILQTFCMSPAKNGLRQRQGYFDTQNGIYIELDGNTLNFVRRSYASGVLNETRVNQANWNVDTMDGNGPSNFTLHIDRTQIMFIDIEWLGVGSVRVGFVIQGKFCLCHVFHHANEESTGTSDTTLPYMTTACLPVRAEFENVANTGSISNYRIICTSIISEGGYELRGRPRSIGTDVVDAPRNLPTKNVFYPVVSIRLKSNRLGAIVTPVQISMIGTTASDFKWKLIVNNTVSGGGAWQSAGADSCVEYKLDGTNSITDGTVLKSGYFTSTAGSSPIVQLQDGRFKFQLERNTFTGTAYTFTLAVAAKADNDKVHAAIDWEEIT